MKSFSVGGHKYTDPDVLSLIFSKDVPVDPRAEVLQKARDALNVMGLSDQCPKTPSTASQCWPLSVASPSFFR